MKLFLSALAVAALGFIAQPSLAEEGVVAETKEAAADAAKNTKQAARNADEKICETVNGKADPKCIGKKIKNTAKTVKDEVHDKTH